MAEDQTTKQQTEKLSYKLEDLSKKSTSELIEYNKKAQEKAEANRKEGLEKQSASLYGQNMNIAKQLKALGGISYEERLVRNVFLLTAIAWIIRKHVLNIFIPSLDDSMIALIAGIILFLLQSRTNIKQKKHMSSSWQ